MFGNAHHKHGRAGTGTASLQRREAGAAGCLLRSSNVEDDSRVRTRQQTVSANCRRKCSRSPREQLKREGPRQCGRLQPVSERHLEHKLQLAADVAHAGACSRLHHPARFHEAAPLLLAPLRDLRTSQLRCPFARASLARYDESLHI